MEYTCTFSMGAKKVHFWLNIHVHSSRILENIHVFLSKGLRYIFVNLYDTPCTYKQDVGQ
jgi:hypothetical protein